MDYGLGSFAEPAIGRADGATRWAPGNQAYCMEFWSMLRSSWTAALHLSRPGPWRGEVVAEAAGAMNGGVALTPDRACAIRSLPEGPSSEER